MVILFSLLLVIIGIHLFKISSFKKSLEIFETNSSSRTWFTKWFLGWQWKLQRDITRWAINSFGDKFVTTFYRCAGIFFILTAAISLFFSIGVDISNH